MGPLTLMNLVLSNTARTTDKALFSGVPRFRGIEAAFKVGEEAMKLSCGFPAFLKVASQNVDVSCLFLSHP